jgi:hypothetical protein
MGKNISRSWDGLGTYNDKQNFGFSLSPTHISNGQDCLYKLLFLKGIRGGVMNKKLESSTYLSVLTLPGFLTSSRASCLLLWSSKERLEDGGLNCFLLLPPEVSPHSYF